MPLPPPAQSACQVHAPCLHYSRAFDIAAGWLAFPQATPRFLPDLVPNSRGRPPQFVSRRRRAAPALGFKIPAAIAAAAAEGEAEAEEGGLFKRLFISTSLATRAAGPRSALHQSRARVGALRPPPPLQQGGGPGGGWESGPRGVPVRTRSVTNLFR